MDAISELASEVGVGGACAGLGVPRSTAYRWQRPTVYGCAPPRPRPARGLSSEQRQEVLDVLCSERFVDEAPRTVHARLLDEDQRYLCHPRTMYRYLQNAKASRERRPQRVHPTYSRPELLATGPNQVWSWDVTWLRGPERYVYYPLYVIIDLFSRYNPGWLLGREETGDLAKKLISDTYAKQGIKPGTLTLHADRGPVPKGKTVKQLLLELDVTRSLSRPRVSNDSPFSEAEFRTLKYGPEYPDRFTGFEHARGFCRKFFAWYNDEHRHSGIAYFTPADVHNGCAESLRDQRQLVMDRAYFLSPERFPNGAPRVPGPPKSVWINPPENRIEFELGLP